MQGKSEVKEVIVKPKPQHYYTDRFFKKLSEPICVVKPLTQLCGGWYLQTFKQVINKLSKNRSSPLPLVFPNVDSMEAISKNKNLLKEVFSVFNSRGFGRIDASELYVSCLALSKGSYETYLKTIVDVFGFENSGRINRNQFFFFLDAYFRAMPKILIIKDSTTHDPNVRLDFKDINRFLNQLFDDKTQIERNQIYEAMMKAQELNEMMKYFQKRGTSSAESSRSLAIEKIKIESEVMEVLSEMVGRVQKQLEK